MNEKVYVAVTTPLPTETAYPIVKEFRKNAANLNPAVNMSANALEGYLVGAIFEDILKKSGKNLTRKRFMQNFEALTNSNIGGVNFTFNKANRQATNRVLITKAEEGELVLLP